jgi:hypothetical protein
VVHIQNCGEDGKAETQKGLPGRLPRETPATLSRDDAGTGETTVSGGQGPEWKESSHSRFVAE